MINPNKFFRTDYGEALRRTLAAKKAVSRIVDFGSSQVFRATTYTCLLFLHRGGTETLDFAEADADSLSLNNAQFQSYPTDCLSQSLWTFENEVTVRLQAKIAHNSMRLLDLPADMSRGSSSGDDEVFVIERGSLDVETEALRIPVFASDFGRYRFVPSAKWRIIFPYQKDATGFHLPTESEIRQELPKTYQYLLGHTSRLKCRKQFKQWFGYSAPRNLELHDHAQIAVPLLADQGLAAMIPTHLRGRLCPMASGGFTITIQSDAQVRPEYVLGLLNSRLLFWRLRKTSNVFRGGWITCTKQYFGELPIHRIDFSNGADKLRHDRMVALVEGMLSLHKSLSSAKTADERNAIQRQIEATDKEIDRLVYELYGLTYDEIQIVEEATR